MEVMQGIETLNQLLGTPNARRYKITDKATGAPLAKLPLTVPIAAMLEAFEAEGYEVEWSWSE
jgi:hypothetical protein